MNSKDREQLENFNATLEDVKKSLAYIHSDLSMKLSDVTSSILKFKENVADLEVKPTPTEVVESTNFDGFSTLPSEEPKVVERTVVAPRNSESRPNLFVDDGSLHRDADNITPKTELVPRQRGSATENFSQVICQRCNSNVQVHPTHVRDYYVCDGCLTGRSKKVK